MKPLKAGPSVDSQAGDRINENIGSGELDARDTLKSPTPILIALAMEGITGTGRPSPARAQALDIRHVPQNRAERRWLARLQRRRARP